MLQDKKTPEGIRNPRKEGDAFGHPTFFAPFEYLINFQDISLMSFFGRKTEQSVEHSVTIKQLNVNKMTVL